MLTCGSFPENEPRTRSKMYILGYASIRGKKFYLRRETTATVLLSSSRFHTVRMIYKSLILGCVKLIRNRTSNTILKGKSYVAGFLFGYFQNSDTISGIIKEKRCFRYYKRTDRLTGRASYRESSEFIRGLLLFRKSWGVVELEYRGRS